MGEKKNRRGIALPLVLIVVLGVGSFFIQIVFNKGTQEADGGPCDYDNQIYPAEVIEISGAGSGYHQVLFRVDLDTGSDTIAYSAVFGSYASDDQLKRKGIKMGEKFQFIIKDIVSGTCTPHIEQLSLEKY